METFFCGKNSLARVLQGFVLEPLLFLGYMNDLTDGIASI